MAQPADSPSSNRAGLTNLQKRILSAAVLLPLVVVEIILGHPYFDVLVALFAGVMAWEWARVCARRRNPADPAPAARLPADGWHAPALVSIVTAVTAVLAAGFGQGGPMVLSIVVMGAVLSGLLALHHHGSRAAWFSIGTIYVTLPALALLMVRADPQSGQAMLFWIIAL